LPGAAITTIERFELPAGTALARLAGRQWAVRQLTPATPNTPAVVMGPVTKLDLTWEASADATSLQELLAAEARYDVRIEERALTTRARLTLKVLSGVAGVFSVQAPPAAEVTLEGAPAGGTARVERPRDARTPIWTIRREPSADDLVVDVYLRTEIAAGRLVSVPTFRVSQASQQRGTLTVGGPPNLRLAFRPSNDLTRREGPDELNHDAVFTYHSLPESGTPLEIDILPMRGDVETHVSHQLTLVERGWRWQAKIDVQPVRTEVTFLDLDMPDELHELRPTSAELVEALTPVRDLTAGWKQMRVQLAEVRRRPFTIVLEGLYPLNSASGLAALPLPRTLLTLDRGGQVTATVPNGLELRGSLHVWERDRPGNWERPLDSTSAGMTTIAASVDRSPGRVDLSWRAPGGDEPVSAVVDIQLDERQATVRHHWRFPFAPAAARPMVVRGAAALAGRLRVLDGGVLTLNANGDWTIQCTNPGAGPTALRGHEAEMPAPGRAPAAQLTLAYSFPLPSGPVRPPVLVPLVWLDPCPRCETTVRVWAGATTTGILLPAVADGQWTELPPQPVPESPTLPALVLHGSGAGLPLSVRLCDAGPGPGTALVVERAWVQVVVDDDRQQAYRARYLIRPRQTHFLEVELPGPPATIQFSALLDGKQMPWQAVEGPAVQLRLDPAAERAPQALELSYSLLPRGADQRRWRMALIPPRLRGLVFVGPTRWQVGLTPGDLPIFTGEGADFEQQWSWQRGLLTPHAAWSSGALQQWFSGGVRTDAADAEPADNQSALVAWQSTAEPLWFVLVPRPLMLLVVSLTVVGMGLAAARRAGRKWMVGFGVILAILFVWLAITYPQPFALLLYAAEPGAAVLLVVLGMRWLVRGHHRQRVLFLPGFAHPSATDPARAQNGLGAHSRREPGTAEASASGS
jgi:hypothetical protein